MPATVQPPTGLTVAKGRTHVRAKWNRSQGAASYHVRAEDASTGELVNSTDVGPDQGTAVVGNLSPGGTYNVRVFAAPNVNGQHAAQTVTLPKSG